MKRISPKNRDRMASDRYYGQCIYEHYGLPQRVDCRGRITWEHALIYAGQQVDEVFAILPVCEYHHLGAGMCKRFNKFVALSRATDEDFAKYPKVNWRQELSYLTNLFNDGKIFDTLW